MFEHTARARAEARVRPATGFGCKRVGIMTFELRWFVRGGLHRRWTDLAGAVKFCEKHSLEFPVAYSSVLLWEDR